MTPSGVGTTAHIVARFLGGMMVEQIEREFTEVTPDERIVSRAHGRVRFVGRTKDVPNGPVFTWLFEPDDAGTKLTFVVLEEDLGWWQRVMESITAVAMTATMNRMLQTVKTGAERRASSAA